MLQLFVVFQATPNYGERALVYKKIVLLVSLKIKCSDNDRSFDVL